MSAPGATAGAALPSLLRQRMANPVHQGELPGATTAASVGNPACGDVLHLWLRIDGGVIRDARFESIGSPYQLATASVLCDCVIDGTVAQARERSPTCVLDKLPDLPRNARYLARLAVDALNLALDADAPRPQSDECSEQGLRRLGDGEAEAWLRGLLADGARLATTAIDAAARDAGACLPGSTARFLAKMRDEGTVACEADAETREWVWMLRGH